MGVKFIVDGIVYDRDHAAWEEDESTRNYGALQPLLDIKEGHGDGLWGCYICIGITAASPGVTWNAVMYHGK